MEDQKGTVSFPGLIPISDQLAARVWCVPAGQPRETVLWQLGLQGLELACKAWAVTAAALEQSGLLDDALASCENCLMYAPDGTVGLESDPRQEMNEGTLATFPGSHGDFSTSTRSRAARWWSAACAIQGRCLLQMVDPSTQDRTQRDALRHRAVFAFALSCRWAALAKDPASVRSAATHLLGAIKPLDGTVVSRGQLVPYLRCALHAMLEVGSQSDPRLVAAIGARAARAMLAAGENQAALQLLAEVFEAVPVPL